MGTSTDSALALILDVECVGHNNYLVQAMNQRGEHYYVKSRDMALNVILGLRI